MSRLVIRIALALLVGLFGACSSFDAQWKAAGRGAHGATRWDGRWASGVRRNSDGSEHGGRLRCVLEPQEGNQLTAHFHANWLIFSGNYDLALHPVPGGPHRGHIKYEGTHDLPAAFGGTYHYQATLALNEFAASYRSSYDQGSFQLKRVPSGEELPQMHAGH